MISCFFFFLSSEECNFFSFFSVVVFLSLFDLTTRRKRNTSLYLIKQLLFLSTPPARHPSCRMTTWKVGLARKGSRQMKRLASVKKKERREVKSSLPRNRNNRTPNHTTLTDTHRHTPYTDDAPIVMYFCKKRYFKKISKMII